MEVTGDDTTVQNPQNLNELQSLLVSFNKEIEDQPSILVHSVIDQQNQQLYVTPTTSNIASDSQAIIDGSTKQTFAGFYTEQNILGTSIHDENESHMSVSVTAQSETQEQGIHVASLISQRDNSSTTSLNEEDLPIQAFNPNELATLNDADGNVLRIVSIGNDGQMHIINEDQLQQGSEVTTDVLTHMDEKRDGGETALDGTDPVAVLASVAANTSSVSQIQTVTLNQADTNNPQLVAIQNSADSSQPQLVAVQNGDGSSTEAVQIIGGSEVANINQTLMANPNNAFQTVTLVPSETGPGGEVSYVLIMGSPDGENIVDGKALSLDLSGYEFKEEDREVTEELVEEDGKTRRILRITPKTALVSGVGGQMMCSYCNYTSPKRYLLTRHMKTHSEDRPHKCHICGRGFKTLASLTNHVNTHTGVRPHKCKLCESAFTTSGELVRHVRYKHTFEKPHKCTLCEYASVELSKLKRHMRSHTGERPYQCPHCTYASPDTYKLKRHLRIHTGEKPYECMVCHARFTQSNSLKAHKLIHTGTKPIFQCEFCPTTCGRRTDLKIHVQKLHNSEHPLLCRKCNQTFPDRYTYKIHLKSHEGEKCFKCDTCGHAAISQRHLETHQLIHSGQKPYECESCDHSFRQKQLLKRHQSLHHSTGENSEKEDCHTVTSQYISLVPSSISQSENSTGTETTDVSNEIITQNILEKNLMQEWRDGKLGNAQQVVIVHPDGTVEEVTHKLHGFQAAHIQDDDETIELKPDVSQIILRHEVKSEDEASALVISSIDSTDQVIDETKEAGTQAEFEAEIDENSKNYSIHSNEVPQSLEQSYQTTEQSVNQNIQSGNLEEFDLSDEHTVNQEDVNHSLHSKVPESVDSETAVFEQEEFIEALDDTEINTFTRENTEDPNPIEGDDVSSSHYLVHESDQDIIPDTQPLTEIDSQGAGIQVQTSVATDKKTFPVSPNRQTRSMKRKEDIDAQSPAKRTRRSTMDS